MIRNTLLGRLDVWLCDRFYPRPATKCEEASSSQYCQLMIDTLCGKVRHYGRDRALDAMPIIAERKDYDKIYGRVADKEEAK